MEIVLPGQVDEESNQEINICIICQYSENVNIYLCKKYKYKQLQRKFFA